MKTIIKEHIKAIFFDIDGTYYDQVHYRIPEENIHAVNALQKAGYKVALASARPFLTAKDLPILEGVSWDGIVSAGGQEVYNEQYHRLHINMFSKEATKKIFTIAAHYHFPIYAVGSHAYFTEHGQYVDDFKKKFHLDCDVLHSYDDEAVLLITLLMGKDFHYEPYFSQLKNIRIQYTGGVNTDIFPKHCSKPSGIHKLMQYWGFPETNYMAFGDSGSDVEMMQDAYFSVAMGNGNEACKRSANYVCGNSDESGISKFLIEHGFLKTVR